ncbi:AT-hook motif nuclear-localized protein 5 [Syzygium oleosum]|uniref:AT-hook motif nuclear-localized protein 5 n=1 Tax=Syzygium oleosum TaxID=219896 RepID=UPI0011D27959|nr:AT-hook motif nuclear-localized protein 5 [Syzygium oleosum]
MDGREAMAMSGGSAQYFIHRGVALSGAEASGLNAPPVFRALTNPHVQAQSNVRSSLGGPVYAAEPSNANFSHGINMGMSSAMPSSEPVKKKRGRPRKYGPDGKVPLGLLPMSATPSNASSGSLTESQKRARGRPPGSGRKQRLAATGEWMNSSAGIAFAPHVITVGPGEDVAAKVLSFAQQRPRAVCILSGSGTVSAVTLRLPASSGETITFEGRFEILCLSGSYLVAEDGGPRNRTGGISVSLSSPDGHVVGGSVAMLVAASLVQVVVCSFVYGNSKPKNKELAAHAVDEDTKPKVADNKAIVPSNAPSQSYTPSPVGIWPGSRQLDLKSLQTGIDLTRG